jgi:hypothetical protein
VPFTPVLLMLLTGLELAQAQSSLKQPLLYKKHPQVSRLILRIQTQENPDIRPHKDPIK